MASTDSRRGPRRVILRGLINFGDMDDVAYGGNRETYARYLGHETSHMWWTGAPSEKWEDWLNGDFADNSALLVIREIFGEGSVRGR
jgi:hypothetical protein